MTEKVTVRGYIIVPKQDIEAVRSALADHIGQSLNEPGCLAFEVQQDANNECKFHVYEEFVDQRAYELHRRQIRQSHWGQVTWNVARHYEVSDEG